MWFSVISSPEPHLNVQWIDWPVNFQCDATHTTQTECFVLCLLPTAASSAVSVFISLANTCWRFVSTDGVVAVWDNDCMVAGNTSSGFPFQNSSIIAILCCTIWLLHRRPTCSKKKKKNEKSSTRATPENISRLHAGLTRAPLSLNAKGSVTCCMTWLQSTKVEDVCMPHPLMFQGCGNVIWECEIIIADTEEKYVHVSHSMWEVAPREIWNMQQHFIEICSFWNNRFKKNCTELAAQWWMGSRTIYASMHRKCWHAPTGRGNAKCQTLRVFLQQSDERCHSLAVRLKNDLKKVPSELRLFSISLQPLFWSHRLTRKNDSQDNKGISGHFCTLMGLMFFVVQAKCDLCLWNWG